ncbi:MAG TPA: TRAM domain-containing protein, partial [Elusimicrobiota bacterium]|nr:TRAM domain-containing protein [Elusimicrobiota bacterium]
EIEQIDRSDLPYKGVRRRGQDVKVIDTSAIIDGRIVDVFETRFLTGPLIVGHFILKELQMIADSSDGAKRTRGRRGLDILQRLQEHPELQVKVYEKDYPEVTDVDGKLVVMARELDAKIITTDFNLNKVASLQGVTVLNVNDLANALKPAFVPGEHMVIFVAKEGKEREQGVGYLDDGTMVVIEDGKRLVGKKVDVVVTSVLQTSAGRMIFTKLREKE